MPRLKKRFGQHHLRRPGLCRPLLDYLAPRGRRVVEIGPGGGVLTRALVGAGARVLALEIDLGWAFALGRRSTGGAASVAVADALEIDWQRLPADLLVAGNLPFNVATPLIERVLRNRPAGSRAAFLVQLEVARRLTSGPGEPDYGAQSVLTAAWAEARILGRVRASDFRPRPAVEAAFVGLELRQPPLPSAEMPGFTAFVRLAFGRRRKTLVNALSAAWARSSAAAVVAALGLPADARAGRLPLETFVELYRAAERQGLEPPRNPGTEGDPDSECGAKPA